MTRKLAIAVVTAAAVVLGSCSTTTRRVDWSSRVGVYTFESVVMELGPPDEVCVLPAGKYEVRWQANIGSVAARELRFGAEEKNGIRWERHFFRFVIADPQARHLAILDSARTWQEVEFDDMPIPGGVFWERRFPCTQPDTLPLGRIQASRRGEAAFNAGNYTQAILYLEESKRMDEVSPSRADFLFPYYPELAGSLWHLGQTDSARVVLDEMLTHLGQTTFTSDSAALAWQVSKLEAVGQSLPQSDQPTWDTFVDRARQVPPRRRRD